MLVQCASIFAVIENKTPQMTNSIILVDVIIFSILCLSAREMKKAFIDDLMMITARLGSQAGPVEKPGKSLVKSSKGRDSIKGTKVWKELYIYIYI